jgi:ribosomal protein S18 acetylase RimI-like enzyme
MSTKPTTSHRIRESAVVEHAAAETVDPGDGTPVGHPLDHAAWAALNGPHQRFAESRGQAVRYRVDVCPFVAVSPDHDERVWDDLSSLVGPGGLVTLTRPALVPPPGWESVFRSEGVQMVCARLEVADDPDVVVLGPDDVPEMLGLIQRTRPGPFLPGTIELGRYLGIRQGGQLIAMAGERLHPPGWTEISAVCTDDEYRGQGLGTRLVRAVGAGIKARGETAFLHAAATNTNAIRLYEQLGFVLRRRTTFQSFRVPDARDAG